MILVTGASGQNGSKAIHHLLNKGVPAKRLIALVRNGELPQSLKEKGITTMYGDYEDLKSLTKAFSWMPLPLPS